MPRRPATWATSSRPWSVSPLFTSRSGPRLRCAEPGAAAFPPSERTSAVARTSPHLRPPNRGRVDPPAAAAGSACGGPGGCTCPGGAGRLGRIRPAHAHAGGRAGPRRRGARSRPGARPLPSEGRLWRGRRDPASAGRAARGAGPGRLRGRHPDGVAPRRRGAGPTVAGRSGRAGPRPAQRPAAGGARAGVDRGLAARLVLAPAPAGSRLRTARAHRGRPGRRRPGAPPCAPRRPPPRPPGWPATWRPPPRI